MATARDPIVGRVAPGAWHHSRDAEQRPWEAKRPRDLDHGIAARKTPLPYLVDDASELRSRRAGDSRRCQRRESEPPAPIETAKQRDRPLAERALVVKEDDSIRARFFAGAHADMIIRATRVAAQEGESMIGLGQRVVSPWIAAFPLAWFVVPLTLLFAAPLSAPLAGPQDASAEATAPHRVLIIATNRATIDGTNRAIGADAREIWEAYTRFIEAGYDVELASPAGGAIPLEGTEALDAKQAAVFGTPALSAALHKSLALASIDRGRYAALYIAGGYGALYDLPDDVVLRRIVAGMLADGGVIGAVGQGVAALLEVKDEHGAALLTGRTITATTNAEDTSSGLVEVLPYSLQAAITAHGASWNANAAFLPNVVVSRRVVTGQNAASASGVVHFVLQLLERSKVSSGPAAR